MSVAVARDIQALRKKLAHEEFKCAVGGVPIEHPECRDTVRRVQNAEAHPYSELRRTLSVRTAARSISCAQSSPISAPVDLIQKATSDPDNDVPRRALPTELSEDKNWSFPVLEA